MTVPGDEVGPRVGLGCRDDELDRAAGVVDDVAADHHPGVGRVGQLLLDDRLALVTELAGGDGAGGAGRGDLGSVALAVVGELDLVEACGYNALADALELFA